MLSSPIYPPLTLTRFPVHAEGKDHHSIILPSPYATSVYVSLLHSYHNLSLPLWFMLSLPDLSVYGDSCALVGSFHFRMLLHKIIPLNFV